MVSITDVALRAGVSPTTVSHALSGKRRVSEAVTRRVRAAMAELDYVPSRSAQNLALGTTRTIALLVPDIGNVYFAELAKGVERTAIGRGYYVMLCTTGFDREREVDYLGLIGSRAVDGVVYAVGSPPTDAELRGLLGGLPLVFVDEEIEGSQFSAVLSDNEEGGRLAARHLLSLGHRRALVVTTGDETVSSHRRAVAFREVWTAAGGTCVIDGAAGFTEEAGAQVARAHLDDLGPDATSAVFALNDLMAIGAMAAMREAGLSIPEDVSVVGFDDSPVIRYHRPAPTSVRQDVHRLGVVATEAILDSLTTEVPLDGSKVVVPVELVVRDSTAPRRTT